MHLPRYLSSIKKKGQTLIEFMIIFPVLIIMITAFHSFYIEMIYREIGQSEMWFMMRATTVDPFIQEYRAEDCADLISKALPYNVAVSTSAEWGQIKDVDPTLSFFNWLQPFDPCFLETVQMKLIYINILSKYFLFGDIHINGAMWTSYANKHPGDYKLVTTVMVYAVLPFSLWVSGVIELLGNVPSYVVELLTGH